MGSSPRRPLLSWAIKIAVSAGLLTILLLQVDLAELWRLVRTASVPWIVAALALYFVMLALSTWRWALLLRAQRVPARFGALMNSFLVAMFVNNFLPSNIGGDVIRIRDTARSAGSKTLATAVILADRGLGVLGLVIIAACGSTLAARTSPTLGPIGPGLLWAALAGALGLCALTLAFPAWIGRLARPLRRFHAEWVDARIALVTGAMLRFRQAPQALLGGLIASIVVQAILVAFYAAVSGALHLSVPLGHLAIVVPVSFIVQMLPVSVGGLGVREATFGLYLSAIGVPLEHAVALSFIGAALVMLFSMSGAAAYVARRDAPSDPSAAAPA